MIIDAFVGKRKPEQAVWHARFEEKKSNNYFSIPRALNKTQLSFFLYSPGKRNPGRTLKQAAYLWQKKGRICAHEAQKEVFAQKTRKSILRFFPTHQLSALLQLFQREFAEVQ